MTTENQAPEGAQAESGKDRFIAGVRLRRHPDGSFQAETPDRVMCVDPQDDAENNYAGELVSVDRKSVV